MGILCDMQLDNRTSIYQPGQKISGRVILTLDERLLLKALAIKISGFACTRWEKPRKEKSISKLPTKEAKVKPVEYYESSQHYLCTTNYFIGSEEANPRIVESGRYIYSFVAYLPANCPTSFETNIGRVRYELEVLMDYPDHCWVCASYRLQVLRPLDLRPLGALAKPLNIAMTEKLSPFKFWHTPLEIQVNTPQSGYIPGENISVHVKIQNRENLSLGQLIYKFNLIGTYAGSLDGKSRHCILKVEKATLVRAEYPLFGQNGNFIEHLHSIHVPETTPTMLSDECSEIQIAYEVEVQLKTIDCKRGLNAMLPIRIGTISLNASNNGIHNELVAIAPSLTAARSMDDIFSASNGKANGEMMARRLSDTDSAYTNIDIKPINIMPATPTAPPLENGHVNGSISTLPTTFAPANFMSAANLNKENKHTMFGSQTEFRPHYPIFDFENNSNASCSNGTTATNSNHVYATVNKDTKLKK